jgi:hypothetical protein
MDARQGPDAQPENDRSDDEIIDLTQVVQKEDDDGIVDLTTIIGQPGNVPEEMDSAEDEIIDLKDTVSVDEPADTTQDMDEEVIDLAGMETAEPTTADEADEEVIDLAGMETIDQTTADEADEEVIDLAGMEAAEPIAADEADEPGDLADTIDEEFIDLSELETALEPGMTEQESDLPSPQPEKPATVDEEESIDLQDTVELAPEPIEEDMESPDSLADTMLTDAIDLSDDEMGPAVDTPETEEEAMPDETGPEAIADPVVSEEEVADSGAAVVDGPLEEEPPVAPTFMPLDTSEPDVKETIPLTDEQVEAALERTIEKIYAEKIEQLLIQTIEKTVKMEIQRIKQALMEDDGGITD